LGDAQVLMQMQYLISYCLRNDHLISVEKRKTDNEMKRKRDDAGDYDTIVKNATLDEGMPDGGFNH
jgi:hypothetical protein